MWFIVGLVFHSQIFPLDATVADRWFYFPMVGLLAVIGILIRSHIRLPSLAKPLAIVLIVSIYIVLSIRTVVRNTNWATAIALYTHDREVQTNYDIELNLGLEYYKLKRYTDAMTHYKQSIALRPFAATLYNIASLYEELGNTDEAAD